MLLFTPVSITTLIGTEDARFILNGISPIAKGDLKWRDALLVTGTVNSNRYIGLWKTFPTKTLYQIKEMCTMLFMRLTTELGGNHIWI